MICYLSIISLYMHGATPYSEVGTLLIFIVDISIQKEPKQNEDYDQKQRFQNRPRSSHFRMCLFALVVLNSDLT